MRTIDADDLADVVMTLVGNIEPVGETTADGKAYENLLCLEETLDILHDEIQFLLPNLNRCEYSMKRQGEEAKKYFESLAETISGWMEEYKDGDPEGDEIDC